jgi:hypothetical protein
VSRLPKDLPHHRPNIGIPKRSTGKRLENKEEAMTEQGAQYDHIGSKYDEYTRTATLKQAESYTFFRMVGALDGKRVLDLACGFGFYTLSGVP